MIRPDGTQAAPKGFTGWLINIPWGVSWTAMTMFGSATSGVARVALMAGDETKGHPAGTKTGDVIHSSKAAASR